MVSIDSIAKEFGFREKEGQDGITQHARAQFATFISQDDIAFPFQRFYKQFLKDAQVKDGRNYQEPGHESIISIAITHVSDPSRKDFRGYDLRTDNWSKQDWYVWFIVTIVDNLRAPKSLWEGNEDIQALCRLSLSLLSWLISHLQYQVSNYYELQRAYDYTLDENNHVDDEQRSDDKSDNENNVKESSAEDNYLAAQTEQVATPSPNMIPSANSLLSDESILAMLRRNRSLARQSNKYLELSDSMSPLKLNPDSNSKSDVSPIPIKRLTYQVSTALTNLASEVLFCNSRGIPISGDFPTNDLTPLSTQEINNLRALAEMSDTWKHNQPLEEDACNLLNLEVGGRYWLRGMSVMKDCLTSLQVRAVVWAIKALNSDVKAAYLFDEMGLGKTITAIAVMLYFLHCQLDTQSKPTLLLVPKNVLGLWADVIQRWTTPDNHVLIYASKDSINSIRERNGGNRSTSC